MTSHNARKRWQGYEYRGYYLWSDSASYPSYTGVRWSIARITGPSIFDTENIGRSASTLREAKSIVNALVESKEEA